jgi:Arc/MetJ-type ribon-helix-helix transcriptional regulator
MSLDQGLSPQTEQFLNEAVASGLFPSKAAAIDAAVDALREKNASVSFVPDEHMEAVEAAMHESKQGLATPMSTADWALLRQRTKETADRNSARNR